MLQYRSFFLACALVGCLNAFVGAGYALAALGAHGDDVYARYALARALPLAVAMLVFSVRGSASGVVALATTLAAVQACDAVVGLGTQDLGKTLGPAILALATGACALLLARSAHRKDGRP